MISKILEELKGLKLISRIRKNFKKPHITAVVNGAGILQDEPKTIVDTFAEFDEKLYSSRISKSDHDRRT